MKSSIEMTGSEISSLLASDVDLASHFPPYPCLIPELQFIPYGKNEFIVLGTGVPRVIKCSGSRDDLVELLEGLDGKNSIHDLLSQESEHGRNNLQNVVAFLFHHGMLQNGPIDPVPSDHEVFASFIGRHLDGTRHVASRQESLERLASAKLALYLPGCASEEADLILRFSCIGKYRLCNDIKSLEEFAPTFLLLVLDGTDGADLCLEYACKEKVPHLCCEIGAAETRLGPLVLPTLSASHHCARMQLPAMAPHSDPNEILFWTCYALHECLLLLGGICIGSYINRITRHFHSQIGGRSVQDVVARIPGGRFSGLEVVEPLDPASSAFQVWKHHCSTKLAPRGLIPPKIHQNWASPEISDTGLV